MSMRAWLALLVVTVAVTAGAAWSLVARQQATAEIAYGEPLFPGLIERVNDVQSITFRTATAAYSLKRDAAGHWVMPERGGYPANGDRAKEIVVALADARIVEPKTARAELYSRIGVQDMDQADKKSESMEVGLSDAAGKALARLIVGKVKVRQTSSEPAKVYVRKVGDDRSWLVEARFDLKTEPREWLNREIVRIERKRVRDVVIRQPDGAEVRLARKDRDDTEFVVADLPEGLAQGSLSDRGGVASGLSLITFDDVRPLADVAFVDPVVTTFTTYDGLRVVVRTVATGETDKNDRPTYWSTFEAEFDPTLVETAEPAAESQDSADDEDEPRDVAQEAREINARVKGWAYFLPDFRAQNFTRRLDELTKPANPEGES